MEGPLERHRSWPHRSPACRRWCVRDRRRQGPRQAHRSQCLKATGGDELNRVKTLRDEHHVQNFKRIEHDMTACPPMLDAPQNNPERAQAGDVAQKLEQINKAISESGCAVAKNPAATCGDPPACAYAPVAASLLLQAGERLAEMRESCPWRAAGWMLPVRAVRFWVICWCSCPLVGS